MNLVHTLIDIPKDLIQNCLNMKDATLVQLTRFIQYLGTLCSSIDY